MDITARIDVRLTRPNIFKFYVKFDPQPALA